MKSFYLLDTNIISEIRKPFPNQNVMNLFMQKKPLHPCEWRGFNYFILIIKP